MKQIRLIILVFASLFLVISASAQQKPALSWKDVSKWRSIKPFYTTLSPDGQWMAYVTGPVEGGQEVVVRKTADTITHRYPCGATGNSPVFSNDSKFIAFKVSAKDAEVKAAKKTKKTLYDKLLIVNLANNTKTEFDRISSFGFSGKLAGWVAIQFAPLETASKEKDAAKGTDLLLYNASTKKSYNMGNVNGFAFNKWGNMLAYSVDANDHNGNGVYLHNLLTGTTSAIDNDKAVYKSITWNEPGTAFALLKSNKNKEYKDDIYSVIGVTKVQEPSPQTVIYNGLTDKSFPTGYGVSGDRSPYWSEDFSALLFGIRQIEKNDKPDSAANTAKVIGKDSSAKKLAAAAKVKKDDIEKPDMIIWNWKDRRLQSQQQVQETADKAYSFLSEYRVINNKFIQLADSDMRSVQVAPKQAYAIGTDNSQYELMGNLDGQQYADVYSIDLNTGVKKTAFHKILSKQQPGF